MKGFQDAWELDTDIKENEKEDKEHEDQKNDGGENDVSDQRE